MPADRVPPTFQQLIQRLNAYWAEQGCVLIQPLDLEVGAGTFHPATFLRALGPEPWNAAYVQPCRRPTDGRYGENPNRLQRYYQYQVAMKPSPDNIVELYFDSLKHLGIDPLVHDLRLVDWTPVAFDAEMHSVRRPGVKQRISQRAVQNISSVGDASFVSSLQGRLIGLFDDFGYANLGISCRLANEVCEMGGLHSAGNSFTIVEGSGLPRLNVVGFNRRVDWPTLVERLEAVGKGDVKPVVE